MEAIVPAFVQCPFCWETFELEIDTTQGSYETIEDCTVCCRPMNLRVECEPGEVFSVESEA
jgi:hypothetical protein